MAQRSIIRNKKDGSDAAAKKDAVGDSAIKKLHESFNQEQKATHKQEVAEQNKNNKKKTTAAGMRQETRANEPKYKIVHRGEFDLIDYRNAAIKAPNTGRPKELHVAIELPLCKSARHVDLDVSEAHIALHCTEVGPYHLDLDLPYPVNEEKGAAKFDKSKRTLNLTLPVKPYVNPEPTAATAAPSAENVHQNQNQNENEIAAGTADSSTDEAEAMSAEAAENEKHRTTPEADKNATSVGQGAQRHENDVVDAALEAACAAIDAVNADDSAIPSSMPATPNTPDTAQQDLPPHPWATATTSADTSTSSSSTDTDQDAKGEPPALRKKGSVKVEFTKTPATAAKVVEDAKGGTKEPCKISEVMADDEGPKITEVAEDDEGPKPTKVSSQSYAHVTNASSQVPSFSSTPTEAADKASATASATTAATTKAVEGGPLMASKYAAAAAQAVATTGAVPFVFHQTPGEVTLVVQIAGVEEDSADVGFVAHEFYGITTHSLAVAFKTSDGCAHVLHVRFDGALKEDMYECDVTGENMVLVVTKDESCTWKRLRAGATPTSLKERLFPVEEQTLEQAVKDDAAQAGGGATGTGTDGWGSAASAVNAAVTKRTAADLDVEVTATQPASAMKGSRASASATACTDDIDDAEVTFYPAPTFDGSRAGYVFHKGPQGVGYYLDHYGNTLAKAQGKKAVRFAPPKPEIDTTDVTKLQTMFAKNTENPGCRLSGNVGAPAKIAGAGTGTDGADVAAALMCKVAGADGTPIPASPASLLGDNTRTFVNGVGDVTGEAEGVKDYEQYDGMEKARLKLYDDCIEEQKRAQAEEHKQEAQAAANGALPKPEPMLKGGTVAMLNNSFIDEME